MQLTQIMKFSTRMKDVTGNCPQLNEQGTNDVSSVSFSLFYALEILLTCLNPPSHQMCLLRKASDALKSRDTSRIVLRELLSYPGLGHLSCELAEEAVFLHFSMIGDALPICFIALGSILARTHKGIHI